MRQTFLRLGQAIYDQILPEQRDIDEFAAQVEIMVSYPGFGDSCYHRLQELCARLSQDRAAADMARLVKTMADLVELKGQCHLEAREQG